MVARLCGLALAAALLAAPAAAEPAFQDRYADNAGVKIHYTAAGEGPLVVLIHGFGDTWHTWRALMDELDEAYRVAAVDLRPHASDADAELWVASDLAAHQRPGPLRRDHVLGIGQASLTLAQTTIRRPAGRALDLGGEGALGPIGL